MMFARQRQGVFSTSKIHRQGLRPARSRRPVLGLERYEERMLLSIALVGSSTAGVSERQ